MQDYDKDFKDYIETLPPEIKQAIYSIDYPKKLQEIVKNNKLLIDQAGKLEAETTLVMAGVEPMDKYVKNLINNVGLSSIQASVIAHDVNETIFKSIRDSLKKINDQIVEEEKIIAEHENNSTQESVQAGIEQPENIKNIEPSISMSSLKSNIPLKPEIHPEMAKEGIEIKVNNLPEIAPKAILPVISSLSPKPTEPFHLNIPPVQGRDIVEAKLTSTVVVPKENITVVSEKTKLPEKPKTGGDPYRESVI